MSNEKKKNKQGEEFSLSIAVGRWNDEKFINSFLVFLCAGGGRRLI